MMVSSDTSMQLSVDDSCAMSSVEDADGVLSILGMSSALNTFSKGDVIVPGGTSA